MVRVPPAQLAMLEEWINSDTIAVETTAGGTPGGGVMKNFRFRYETRRAHVHVRLFSGRALHKTHGKNGGLVFSADEWDQFVGCLRAHVKWCTKTRSARRRAAAAGLAGAKATGAQVGT
jgi:hypothetical protein